jgi:hypothetical protein
MTCCKIDSDYWLFLWLHFMLYILSVSCWCNSHLLNMNQPLWQRDVGCSWTECWGECLDLGREVTVGWRKHHIHELHNLYLLPNNSRSSIRPVEISKGYSYKTLCLDYLNFVAWEVLEIQMQWYCDNKYERRTTVYGLHVSATQRILYVKGGHCNADSIILTSAVCCCPLQLPFITATNL